MAKKYYLDGKIFKPGPGRNTSFIGQANPKNLNDIILEVVGTTLPIVPATTTVQGIVELATNAEAIAKASTTVVITPSNLAALGASTTFAGFVELATDAEAIAGVSTTVAITPANLTAALTSAGDLESVLTNGNTTGANDIVVTSGQVLASSVGGVELDLAFGGADNYALTTDAGAGLESYISGTITQSTLGFGNTNNVIANAERIYLSSSIGAPGTFMNTSSLGTYDTTGIIPNKIIDVVSTGGITTNNSGGGTTVFINTGNSVDSQTNAGLNGSVILGGDGITAKTDNTAYANQIAFNNNAELFEGLMYAETLTADRTYELPNASGVVSLIRTSNTAISASAQDGEIVLGTGGGAGITITLPTPVGADNMKITVKKIDIGVGAVNVATPAGTFDGAASPYVLAAQWNSVTLVSNSGEWYILATV